MKRLTRHLDEFPCRLAESCQAEEWMRSLYKEYPPEAMMTVCDNCPFETIINRLAEYEDQDERREDDLK